MAEEFEAAGMIYGGNWWNMMNTCSSSSLCSIAANNDGGNYFSCSWQTHHNLVDLKSNDSLGFLVQPKQNQNESSSSPSASGNNNGNILMDSTLAFALSPSSNLLGRPESNNFQSVLEEEGGGVDSSNSEMKTMNQEFAIDHQQNLSSYGLYDDEHNNPLHRFQPEEFFFTNPSVAFITYNSTNQVSPTWSKPSDHDHFLKPSSMPKQQLAGFHFSNNNNNNNPFWNNASADDVPPPPPPHVLASSPQSQTFERKPTSYTPLLTKHKREEAHVSDDPSADAFKRPRIETPSPLPTFKVRKEKLGDRITALQQLVSPFGKTDTASVLHEAIEYIKYLHDQVSVLSASYLNNNGTPVQHYQGCDEKESKQDLRSQGLCLAPISSTFTLAKYEMMANELWPTAYGGALNLMG